MKDSVALDLQSPAFFITGTSRSGTGLMEQVLKSVRGVTVTPETHYFDDLRPRLPSGGAPLGSLSAEHRRAVATYFARLRSGRFGWVDGNHELSNLELCDTWSADEVFVRHGMDICKQENASVWGEKTPRHVFRINEILDIFPDAKVVHMIRDPRAVAASYKNWASSPGRMRMHPAETSSAAEAESNRVRRSYNPVLNGLLWRSATKSARVAQARYGEERIRLVRYEDLVQSPEVTASAVVRWLGLSGTPDLGQVAVANSSFCALQTSSGVLTDFTDRWRVSLAPSELALCQLLAGRDLEGSGYCRERVRLHRARGCFAGVMSLPGIVRAVVANRKRLGNPANYVYARVRALRA